MDEKPIEMVETKVKNKLGRKGTGEKHTQKSMTNKTQWFTLQQQISTMTDAGRQRQELLQANYRASHEIDRTDINNDDIWINAYKSDKIDTLERGREANEYLKEKISQANEQARATTGQMEHTNGHSRATQPESTNQTTPQSSSGMGQA